MARPHHCRIVRQVPRCATFKPAGIPALLLEQVTLTLDEFEALRLGDLEGMYQEEAAARMNVSRATYARIVESARRKVARVLVEGLALQIEGGSVQIRGMRKFACRGCGHHWSAARRGGQRRTCPACAGVDLRSSRGRNGSDHPK